VLTVWRYFVARQASEPRFGSARCEITVNTVLIRNSGIAADSGAIEIRTVRMATQDETELSEWDQQFSVG